MTRALVPRRLFRIFFCVQTTLLGSAFSVTLEEALDAPALSWQGSLAWEGVATAVTVAKDGFLETMRVVSLPMTRAFIRIPVTQMP